jgi:hypothetical protein
MPTLFMENETNVYQLSFTADANFAYLLEYSSDLKTWRKLEFFLPFSIQTNLVTSVSADSPMKFFRVAAPE